MKLWKWSFKLGVLALAGGSVRRPGASTGDASLPNAATHDSGGSRRRPYDHGRPDARRRADAGRRRQPDATPVRRRRPALQCRSRRRRRDRVSECLAHRGQPGQ